MVVDKKFRVSVLIIKEPTITFGNRSEVSDLEDKLIKSISFLKCFENSKKFNKLKNSY